MNVEEEERASAALIAQMLREEQESNPYIEGQDFSEDDDDLYDPRKGSKKGRAKGGKRGRQSGKSGSGAGETTPQKKRKEKKEQTGSPKKPTRAKKNESSNGNVEKKVLPERNRGKKHLSAFTPAVTSHTDANPLPLLPCTPFSVQEAPFRLKVSAEALMLADLHAHLINNEVIGFLGGVWDPEAKVLNVKKAFPCRSLIPENDEKSMVEVEVDPEAETEVRAKIEGEGMVAVGWYHSHPHFPPSPSEVDIQNQSSYQALFDGRIFVGLIISPHDERLPTSVSKKRWFVVHQGQPREMEGETIDNEDLDGILSSVNTSMVPLLHMYENYSSKVPLTHGTWRFVKPDKDGLLVPCNDTYVDKLAESLSSLIPSTPAATSVASSTKWNDLLSLLNGWEKL